MRHRRLRAFAASLAAGFFSLAAPAGASDDGWSALAVRIEAGDAGAARDAALRIADGAAPGECLREARCRLQVVPLLLADARRGELRAFLALESLRMRGGPGAPGLADIVAAEREVVARRRDPSLAWRLVRRADAGEIDAAEGDRVAWLLVAADGAKSGRPFARDAAYRLCQAYARGDGAVRDDRAARRWCDRAAKDGHAGAVMVLAQLRGAGD